MFSVLKGRSVSATITCTHYEDASKVSRCYTVLHRPVNILLESAVDLDRHKKPLSRTVLRRVYSKRLKGMYAVFPMTKWDSVAPACEGILEVAALTMSLGRRKPRWQ